MSLGSKPDCINPRWFGPVQRHIGARALTMIVNSSGDDAFQARQPGSAGTGRETWGDSDSALLRSIVVRGVKYFGGPCHKVLHCETGGSPSDTCKRGEGCDLSSTSH